MLAAACLTGCFGKANGDSSALLCGDLPEMQLHAVRDAASEWNGAVGSDLTVDSTCRESESRLVFKLELANMTAEGRTWLEVWGDNRIVLHPSLTADQTRTTALHEIGHALGLHHSAEPSDVMFPSDEGAEHLTENDIAAYWALRGESL